MGRGVRPVALLAFACAFSSCFAEVAQGAELSPATTFIPHMAPSAQPLSLSSPHRGTTVHFNSTISRRPSGQGTGEPRVTAAPGHGTAAQAGAATAHVTTQKSPTVASTPPDDNTTAAGRATTQATVTVTPAVNTTAVPAMSSAEQTTTQVSTEMTAAATNATVKHTTPSTRMTAAAITATASTTPTVQPTAAPGNQTTALTTPTATTSTTTVRPGTQTSSPSTTVTERPTLAPRPSPIPTGAYAVSDGNRTCIKAVMGLQLMAQNAQGRMEYMAVDPSATRTSGRCGTVRSELNITFSGGFLSFTFVKEAPTYYVSKIESSLQLSSEGTLYHAAVHEKLFTTKLGDSYKCASEQTFCSEKNFQLLFVHMQLQAFDIVGDQFGKGPYDSMQAAAGHIDSSACLSLEGCAVPSELHFSTPETTVSANSSISGFCNTSQLTSSAAEEECFPDKNSRAVPIVVGLSILGLLVIAFATFLISRRKPHRGYERI